MVDFVASWLADLKLQRYESNFVEHGYDDRDVILALSEQDLDTLGITLAGHRKRLLLAAGKLAAKLEAATATTAATTTETVVTAPGAAEPGGGASATLATARVAPEAAAAAAPAPTIAREKSASSNDHSGGSAGGGDGGGGGGNGAGAGDAFADVPVQRFDRREAENVLQGHPEGTFLLRHKNDTQYSISLVGDPNTAFPFIHHLLARQDDGTWHINHKAYNTPKPLTDPQACVRFLRAPDPALWPHSPLGSHYDHPTLAGTDKTSPAAPTPVVDNAATAAAAAGFIPAVATNTSTEAAAAPQQQPSPAAKPRPPTKKPRPVSKAIAAQALQLEDHITNALFLSSGGGGGGAGAGAGDAAAVAATGGISDSDGGGAGSGVIAPSSPRLPAARPVAAPRRSSKLIEDSAASTQSGGSSSGSSIESSSTVPSSSTLSRDPTMDLIVETERGQAVSLSITTSTTAEHVCAIYEGADAAARTPPPGSAYRLFESFNVPPIERMLAHDERPLEAQASWPRSEGCRFAVRCITQIEAGEADEDLMGKMDKRGGGHKSWKTRFFVLESGGIAYYTKQPLNAKDKKDKRLGTFNITGCRVFRVKLYRKAPRPDLCFCIRPNELAWPTEGGDREIMDSFENGCKFMCATNSGERSTWLASIVAKQRAVAGMAAQAASPIVSPVISPVTSPRPARSSKPQQQDQPAAAAVTEEKGGGEGEDPERHMSLRTRESLVAPEDFVPLRPKKVMGVGLGGMQIDLAAVKAAKYSSQIETSRDATSPPPKVAQSSSPATDAVLPPGSSAAGE